MENLKKIQHNLNGGEMILRKKIFKSITALVLACVFIPLSVFAGPENEIMVETTPLTVSMIDPEIVQFDSSVRSVDESTILQWARSANILIEGEELGLNCTWERFLTFLWRMNGSPNLGNTIVVGETNNSATLSKWAIKNGLVGIQLYDQLTHDDVQWSLWHIAGEPEPIAGTTYDLPIGEHSRSELWSCDIGLIVSEEQPCSDPGKQISEMEAITYLYYLYHRRIESSFPISVEQFLASCQNVVDTARMNGYTYGDSHAQNPTTDGIISCDRLVAKALYDLGYTGQPVGGITCGNADEYLYSWGFERSENLYDARRGSIMLVKHKEVDYTSHMYVLASDMDFNNMVADRYDCGCEGYIETPQPLRGEGFWYRTDSIIVYNIPK